MREMAAALGVTERSIQRVLKDLEAEGYITWQGTGKGNIYQINHNRGLKHELTKDSLVGDLLSLLSDKKGRRAKSRVNKDACD